MNMREACTFHANLKLLDEGVEKLASFIESTKRVKGLSLAHNAIGPWGAQVGHLVGNFFLGLIHVVLCFVVVVVAFIPPAFVSLSIV
jgi:hypothetical protein